MTQPDTREGRSPDEALEQIAAQAELVNDNEAGPDGQADLAQWRKDHRLLLAEMEHEADISTLVVHLAAMPAQDVNTELLGALKGCARGFHALAGAVGGEIPDSVFAYLERADAAIAKAEKGAER